jgi:hypothetical protein
MEKLIEQLLRFRRCYLEQKEKFNDLEVGSEESEKALGMMKFYHGRTSAFISCAYELGVIDCEQENKLYEEYYWWFTRQY